MAEAVGAHVLATPVGSALCASSQSVAWCKATPPKVFWCCEVVVSFANIFDRPLPCVRAQCATLSDYMPH